MAVKKVIPKQQAMLEIAGHLDSVTGEELTYAQAAAKVGYAPNTCRIAIHGKIYAAFKKEWHARADKVREIRKKGAERGIEKAAAKKSFDVMTRLIELAELQPTETNNTIGGQVKACEHIAVIKGDLVRQTHELSADDMKRSRTDKEFFATNGYWPEAAKKAESVN